MTGTTVASQSTWETKDLLREAGAPGRPLSYNAIVEHLGGREAAERQWLAAQERQAARSP